MIVALMANDALPQSLIVVAILLAISVVIYSMQRKNEHEDTLKRVAQKLGATYVEGEVFGNPHLELKFGARSARLEFAGEAGNNRSEFTKVVVKVGGR